MDYYDPNPPCDVNPEPVLVALGNVSVGSGGSTRGKNVPSQEKPRSGQGEAPSETPNQRRARKRREARAKAKERSSDG